MLLRSLFATLAVCAAVALAPAAAYAAPGSGGVNLTVGGGALADSGVKALALAPATKRGARIKLPVQTIVVGKSANIVLRGGIRFKAGKRSLKLRAVRLRLSAESVSISARAGKRRVTIFSTGLAKGKAKLDRSKTTAALAGAKLALTRKGARLLRNKLGVDDIVAGKLGKLGVDAKPRTGNGGGGGGSGGGGPKSGPLFAEPPVMARPLSAVDVTGVSIVWYPRDSWVRYVDSGTGANDGFFVANGATKGAPMVTDNHPCSDDSYPGSGQFDYEYHFTAKSSSWYDPVSGMAALYGQGDVRFRWSDHGIDLTVSNPEIEINGSLSRSIFRFSGSDNTAYEGQRAVLTTLSMAGQPTSSGGGAFSYQKMGGRLTKDGESVFAGYYTEGVGWGCVSASFATS